MLLKHPAGFWRRALASVFDEIVCLVVTYVFCEGALRLIHLMLFKDVPYAQAFTQQQQLYVNIVAGIFVGLPYMVGMHYWKGWTLGKRLVNVVVVDYQTKQRLTLKQSFLRYVGHVASTLPFFAGYIMVVFNPEKRGLHDFIAGTQSYVFADHDEPVVNAAEPVSTDLLS